MTGLADGDRRQDAMNQTRQDAVWPLQVVDYGNRQRTAQTYVIGGDGSAVTVPSTHPAAAVAGTNPGPVAGVQLAPRPQPWRLPMTATAGPRPWRLQSF